MGIIYLFKHTQICNVTVTSIFICRKVVATTLQLSTMNETDFQLVCSHLSHTSRVHRDHYRLPKTLALLTKVACHQDMGNLANLDAEINQAEKEGLFVPNDDKEFYSLVAPKLSTLLYSSDETVSAANHSQSIEDNDAFSRSQQPGCSYTYEDRYEDRYLSK